MEIFGVGPSELFLIVILALIILGPKDMQKAGRTIGKWLRTIVTSDGWRIFQQTSRELRTLPNRLMREANEELGDIGKEMRDTASLVNGRARQPFMPTGSVIPTPENKIAPSAPDEKTPNESDSKPDA
jgi:sec-independent protein translocase protein TatB